MVPMWATSWDAWFALLTAPSGHVRPGAVSGQESDRLAWRRHIASIGFSGSHLFEHEARRQACRHCDTPGRCRNAFRTTECANA
jgi:hypothetical protein